MKETDFMMGYDFELIEFLFLQQTRLNVLIPFIVSIFHSNFFSFI